MLTDFSCCDSIGDDEKGLIVIFMMFRSLWPVLLAMSEVHVMFVIPLLFAPVSLC